MAEIGTKGSIEPSENRGAVTDASSEPFAEINGIRVEKSIIINRKREEIYRFWRDFKNLPRIMDHLEEVWILNSNRSHWIAKGPAGTIVEWDAEITSDHENELIAWRSLEGSGVTHAGSVRFLHFAEGQTEVRVALEYEPPAGQFGALIAGVLGGAPEQQITDDLLRLKQIMESEFGYPVEVTKENVI